MGDIRTTRSRPPLKLRKQSLRVLVPNELGQVVGGVRVGNADAHARGPSRNCLTTGAY